MKKEGYFSRLLSLFITFLKVGAFTFGGGYAMIPIIQREVVDKKKWMKDEELLDILAISESTPGPISVNTATYVGYRLAGVLGGIVATLSLALPSFLIIIAISFFYDWFISFKPAQAIFKGLKIGVIILLISAILKLNKSVKWNALSIVLFIISIICSLAFAFLNIKFSWLSIIFIAVGIVSGVISVVLSRFGGKK